VVSPDPFNIEKPGLKETLL
jgi:hypothetical protein